MGLLEPKQFTFYDVAREDHDEDYPNLEVREPYVWRAMTQEQKDAYESGMEDAEMEL